MLEVSATARITRSWEALVIVDAVLKVVVDVVADVVAEVAEVVDVVAGTASATAQRTAQTTTENLMPKSTRYALDRKSQHPYTFKALSRLFLLCPKTSCLVRHR